MLDRQIAILNGGVTLDCVGCYGYPTYYVGGNIESVYASELQKVALD